MTLPMLFRLVSILFVVIATAFSIEGAGSAIAAAEPSERAENLIGADPRLVILPPGPLTGFASNSEGARIVLAQAGNRRPRVDRPITDKRTSEGVAFSFTIPRNTFSDPDGDRLTITTRDNARWLSFNPSTRRLSGTPRAFDSAAVVRVTATDGGGKSVTTSFRVRISPRTLADDAPPAQSTSSLNVDGTEDSFDPSISAHGRFVAHVFEGFNQSTGRPEQSIVLRDFTFPSFSGRGSLTLAGPVSFEPGLSSAALFSSPSVSADGRRVAFVAQTAADAVVQGVEVRVVRIADSDPLSLETKFAQLVLHSDDPVRRAEVVASTDVSLSADGHFVAFEQGPDIVVAKIGTRRRLVINDAGSPSISGDGRRIAYEQVTGPSEREILIATLDIANMRVSDTTVIGTDIDSEFGPQPSNPVISPDGRFVAFESNASDLVPGDSNGARDIFVYDVSQDTIARVNVDNDGNQADVDSFHPSLSRNGRFVVFDTEVPGVDEFDSPASFQQVLGRELEQGEPRGELRVVSVTSDGSPGNGGGGFIGSSRPSLSADGRFVTFQSTSSNLTADAADNQGIAVFVVPAFPNYAPVVDLPFDQPDDSSTLAKLVLGAPRPGEIAPAGDADWYRIELVEGQAYRFELRADTSSSTPLGDPVLEVVKDLAVIASDDDSGGGLNGLDALLEVVAPVSGTFFIAARGFGDGTGDYLLSGNVTSPVAAVSR